MHPAQLVTLADLYIHSCYDQTTISIVHNGQGYTRKVHCQCYRRELIQASRQKVWIGLHEGKLFSWWVSKVLETRLRGLSLTEPDSHTKSGRESGDTRNWVGANRPRNFCGWYLTISRFEQQNFESLASISLSWLPFESHTCLHLLNYLLTVQHQINMWVSPDSLPLFVWESGSARLEKTDLFADRWCSRHWMNDNFALHLEMLILWFVAFMSATTTAYGSQWQWLGKKLPTLKLQSLVWSRSTTTTY